MPDPEKDLQNLLSQAKNHSRNPKTKKPINKKELSSIPESSSSYSFCYRPTGAKGVTHPRVKT
jgi:hypothetical protein